MIHFLRAPDRATAEALASLMVDRSGPLCRSSRAIPGDPSLPVWRVETIACCGEALSSARPVSLGGWGTSRSGRARA